GDRTGLEMIRTLQDHGVHQGIEVYMEHTVLAFLKDGERVVGAFGYERERGRFRIFRAKAIVLATGGIGRAYKITSNSWESTGDGLALGYEAGAELIDMEFVQFHPTGMIWPPSVMGILVTEGVRGEGGILTNKDGRRFMFEAIPENYKAQTADNEEEGWRYCQGDKNARRPPELLTRDHVSRCIVREIKEGRGTLHGGVFLDISWIKQKLPNSAEYIKKKLPSMYHQFKQLADIDITAREALAPFERAGNENPYQVQYDLQEIMQHSVGIVRNENEMKAVLERLKEFRDCANGVRVTGNCEFNPGWHTALDLKNLL